MNDPEDSAVVGGVPEREVLEPPVGGPRHGKGMVPGIRANGFLFFSAIRGKNPADGEYPDSTEGQARQALENLRVLVETAGGTLADVVKVTLYLDDVAYRRDFHKVWMEYFPTDPPARIAVGVENANPSPGGTAHFALDVIALARGGGKVEAP